MEFAYAAIGRAVVAAQIFETTLVPIFEFFKIHTKSEYLEETGGYLSAGMFKVPITSIVKTLESDGHIAPDLKARLTDYAEDRHTLIHCWVQQHGWPDDNDLPGVGLEKLARLDVLLASSGTATGSEAVQLVEMISKARRLRLEGEGITWSGPALRCLTSEAHSITRA
jgi:hypothetical protein